MAVITCIEDLKRLHKKRVPKMFYDYAESGSWTESTFFRNEQALAELQLRQRVAGTQQGQGEVHVEIEGVLGGKARAHQGHVAFVGLDRQGAYDQRQQRAAPVAAQEGAQAVLGLQATLCRERDLEGEAFARSEVRLSECGLEPTDQTGGIGVPSLVRQRAEDAHREKWGGKANE